MKNNKKPEGELLQLVPVETAQSGDNIFKSMSLNDLLAALELIMEFEAIGKEVYSPTIDGRPAKYLH